MSILHDKAAAGMMFVTLPPPTVDWPTGLGQRPRVLLSSERLSLMALICFTAEQLGCAELDLHRALLERFKVATLEDMPAHCFDRAVRYLVDQIPEHALA